MTVAERKAYAKQIRTDCSVCLNLRNKRTCCLSVGEMACELLTFMLAKRRNHGA